MKPCTLWYRKDEDARWVFNHLEDGHVDAAKPTPKHAAHTGWAKADWWPEFAWLSNDTPPRVMHAEAQA